MCRVTDTVALVSGLQGDDPIDGWVLEGLLVLAGVDLDDEVERDEVADEIAVTCSAGFLQVAWAEDSLLEESIARAQDGSGSRYRELVRLRVLSHLWEMEYEVKGARQ